MLCSSLIKKTQKPCQNQARYLVHAHTPGEQRLCGLHSHGLDRVALPKEPVDPQIYQKQQESCDQTAEANRAIGQKGSVILTQLRMMRSPEHQEGILSVFPNYKHGNRKDGLGLPGLSPKSLGPVYHGQPGLPPALNLENFHQFSKCYSSELDPDGQPAKIFYETQTRGFLDPTPHRHKLAAIGLMADQHKNIPICFVWIDREGNKHYLSYIESRQFYCNFYERMVLPNCDFATLQTLLDDGYHLNIIGYDAHPISDPSPAGLEREYLDPRRPFGHELVLYCLLTLTPNDYPWRKHTTFEF